MNPGGHSDDHFDKDLERVGDTYRALDPEEPPALLDQAVLNRARRALESKSVRPWNFGWVHAATTAALIVLAVGIVLQLPDRQAPVPGAIPASSDRDDFRRNELQQSRAPKPAAELEESLREAPVAGRAGRLDAPSRAEPERQGQSVDLGRSEKAAADSAGFEATGDTESFDRRAADPAGARDAAAPAEPRERPAALLEASTAPVKEESAEPPPTGDDGAAQAVVGAPQPVVATGASPEDAPVPEGEKKAEVFAMESVTGTDALRDAGEQAPADAEAWLEHLRELLEAGERDAFEAEFTRFRAAWPEYELPPDIAAALDGAPGE